MSNQSKTKSKLFKCLVFAVVMLLPFIYSFFYLKSYWDPYGYTADLPVAIVNEDEGEKGAKVVQSLKDKNVLKLEEVSSNRAAQGLNDKDYYAVITFPQSFTHDLESAATTQKFPATITYSPNQKSNYLASQIINAVIKALDKSVRSEVSETVVDNLAGKLNEVPGQLTKITDGATQLETGSTSLTAGLTTLNNGLNTLTSGARQLDNGIALINTALANSDTSRLSELTTGIATLSSGASELSAQTTNYVTGVETLAAGLQQLHSTLSTKFAQAQQGCQLYQSDPITYSAYASTCVAATTLQQLTSDPSYQQLIGGATLLATPSATYGNLTPGQALSAGASKLAAGTATLNDATPQLSGLASSLDQLKARLQDVKAATSQIVAGGEQLSSGSTQAVNGSAQLTDGLGTLKSSVQAGLASTEAQLQALDGLADFTANPVNIEEQDVGKVDQYGVSFTPLFLSIGLWVGALMCYVVLYYDREHRFGLFDKDQAGPKQNLAYLGVAAGFGLLTSILLRGLIGFDITNPVTYYGGAILIATAFMALIQLLIRVFGDIGKFLALIVLVLQLAAAGGTFPVETIAPVFRGLNPFLPMTYSINLVKEGTISTTDGFAGSAALVLVLFLVISFTVTTIYDLAKRRQTATA